MERSEQRAFNVFNERFESALADGKNHRETFEKVSQEIHEETKVEFYSSYESFKSVRSRRRRMMRRGLL